jgi:L-ascorbate metabolism protein UlaG (beta-lactamase superfamily)
MPIDDAPSLRITHVGGPTALLEIGPWRLLTDPTFDPPGGRYRFGWGTGSRKLSGPAISSDAIGPIDAVLLSHDHHDDNLDHAGRALLAKAPRVITTVPGARRLGPPAHGLAPWERTTLEQEGRLAVRVTATPARHGPPLSRPIVGHVIGFVLEWEGQHKGALWVSGDTVWFGGITEVGRRFEIGTALLHFGGVRFPISGPVRYTMTAAEGVKTVRELALGAVLPIHYEGWRHFRQGRAAIEETFAAAGLGDRLVWLQPGEATPIDA